MILMPIIMISPFLGLLLFYYLPLGTALPIYIVILVIAAFCYFMMFQSMWTRAKTGGDAMTGAEALVIEDIDPEGKVEIKGEIWNATARGKKIVSGKRVKVLKVNGLVLIVEGLDKPDG